ncbi:uncharacterized protein LOC143377719 [Andrena cerasifolii]|uniref:uncharacterized protein LOC143377719 n=1 Tax=Andrena cerasifolii TaxID=2819439 RepID=UPI0040378692
MPQELNVLHCSSCKMYQVHIVKKAKEWQCKVCNVKQFVGRVFFQGSGKDCRVQVQKLNAMKAYRNEGNASFEMGDDANRSSYRDDCSDRQPRSDIAENKWAKYLGTPKQTQCRASDTSDDTNDCSEEYRDSVCQYNEMEHEYSQNDYTIVNPYCGNDLEEDFSFDNRDKDDDFKIGDNVDATPSSDSIGEKDDSRGKNVTEIKDARSIFDDNEDFDVAIDF